MARPDDDQLARDIDARRIPLVSIITPAFNHERFIEPCIESVVGQTYPSWEQIIIDDGSTDRTAELVQMHSDPRIKYFYQHNKGIGALAETYNRGLQLARGELIAILEGDDVWPSRKLSELVPSFRDPEIVLAFGEERDMDVHGHIARRLSRTARRRTKLPHTVLFNDPVGSALAYMLSLEGQSFIPPATVVIRRTALESIGGFQRGYGISPTDVPTFIRLSKQGKFHYTPTVVGFRRRHTSSATLQFLEPMSKEPFEFIRRFMNSPDLRLSANDRRSIERSWLANTYGWELTAGRICLLKKQWNEARAHFVRALSWQRPQFLIAGAVGWFLSWFRTDLEGVFQLAGRASLKPSE